MVKFERGQKVRVKEHCTQRGGCLADFELTTRVATFLEGVDEDLAKIIIDDPYTVNAFGEIIEGCHTPKLVHLKDIEPIEK